MPATTWDSGSASIWSILPTAVISSRRTPHIETCAHAGGSVTGFVLGILFGWRGRDAVVPIGGDGLSAGFWILIALCGVGALGMVVVLLRIAI